ncbi:membrane-associated protein, putative [Bodo saltans]|uniref:Membrane-associated protein, putative n=1 Tax=Bodo saltans TaxID=75058 RepID=A0A0S4J3G0_BODSA|nr:membrane-associated protein, putative [Bodo saltans]|eukprot:CUG76244.1 membrane-associated protein, putative [Bodo saltans]
MVHNAKHKFLGLSSILSFLIVGLIIGAVAAPAWIAYSSQGDYPQYQGLFKNCRSNSCSSNQFDADGQGSTGSLGCKQSGSELQDRFTATAATLLGAAGIVAIVVLVQLGHVFRIGRLSQASHMWLFWGLILAFVSSLVGVAIFGGTVNSWWNCGSDFCQPYKSTGTSCGVGYGYVFSIVGCGATFISAIIVLTFAKFPHVMFPTNDVVLAAVFLEIFAVVLIGVGVASTEWIVIITNYASTGLFQQCLAWSCNSIDLGQTLTTRTDCDIVGSSVTTRLSASAAVLIVAAVILAVFGVLFTLAHLRISTKLFITNTKKRVTIGFIVLALILEVVGLILATNVFDSYYFCGISFCTNYAGYCREGTAFGLCLGALILTVLLVILHVFEFNACCCFQERFASGRQSFSVWKVLRASKLEGAAGTAEPSSSSTAGGAHPPGTKSQRNSAPTEAKEPIDDNTIQLPSGQWDYDSVSGFYWSEELYLFFDPVTQQFYDPNKDEWFTQDRRTAAAGLTSPHATAAAATSNSSMNRSNNRSPSADRRGGRETEMRSPRKDQNTPRR